MKPFLLRVNKAHYLINLQLYQTIYHRCRIPPYSNSPNLQVGWDTHGFKSLPDFFCVLLRMTVHVSMVYDQKEQKTDLRDGSYFVIEMINSLCQYQRYPNEGSWFKCDTDFLLKKWDDATLGPETNHQVLALSLISFSWKKYWNFGPKIIVKWIIN